MAADLLVLRPAKKEDKELIDYYAYSEGMDYMPGLEGITVAANDEDKPVGFIRMLPSSTEAGVAFVNPIVVYGAWRGWGVGRMLMEDALARCRELRLVARGSSVPFYRALGFAEIPWDAIEPALNEDCDGCELREECHPLPMGKFSRPI